MCKKSYCIASEQQIVVIRFLCGREGREHKKSYRIASEQKNPRNMISLATTLAATNSFVLFVLLLRNAVTRSLVLPSSLPIHHPPQYKTLRNEHMGCGEGWGKSGFGVLVAKKNESRRLRARKLCHKIFFRTTPEYSTLPATARRRAIRQPPVTVTNYRFAFRPSSLLNI